MPENEKNGLSSLFKFLIVLALVIGGTSLTMNLLSMRVEQQAGIETPQGEYWVPQEQAASIAFLAAGSAPGNSTEQLGGLPFLSNYDLSAYSADLSSGGTNFIETASGSGLSLLSLAQPDFNVQQLPTLLSSLDDKGIGYAGMNVSTSRQNQLYTVSDNGIDIAFLSYTDGVNEIIPDAESYLVNVYDDEKTPLQVAKAAGQADVIVVYMTWSGADGAMPTQRQQTIANALASAGASIIIGNSGGIQPVSWIDDTLVYYGLGSFCPEEGDAGSLGAVTITKITTGMKSRIELTNPKADFITGSERGPVLVSQSSLSDEKKTELNNRYSSVILSMDDSTRIGGLE